MVYEFGGFQIDLSQRILVRNGEPIALTPKVFVSAQFSRDGQRIVTASYDHTARVWNVADGRLLVNSPGTLGFGFESTVFPRWPCIVTDGLDNSARVWQILTLDDIDRILAK